MLTSLYIKMIIEERKFPAQRKLDKWGIVIEKFNWKNYNNSQTREKTLFLKLLHELVHTLDGNSYMGRGRKPRPSADMIFCMCLKVYLGTSARRLISELTLCKRSNYLNYVPHFNSILFYFNTRAITHKLKYLIGLSALPLAQLEDKFSIDSSGIAEHKYLPRWSSIRQDYRRHRSYKKIHCIYGVKSNIIASCMVTDGTKGDSPYFSKLLHNAADNFDISEISADAAYLSRENMNIANELNISPYIMFKKNSRGNSRGCPTWSKMYKLFKEKPEKFLKSYHQRSNAESGFFMIKQKFGEFVYSKNKTAQINEILCKILCHNLCVLIQELFLSGIDVDFNSCAKRYVAQ